MNGWMIAGIAAYAAIACLMFGFYLQGLINKDGKATFSAFVSSVIVASVWPATMLVDIGAAIMGKVDKK